MTDYLFTIGIAALLSVYAFWNRRAIQQGRDFDQAFIENDIKSGWLKVGLGKFDYFSKVMMPLMVAGVAIIIGTYRFLDRG